MAKCIYTTQHRNWLNAARDKPDDYEICFRSDKSWKTANDLLAEDGALKVLFRRHEDDGEFTCRFVAELVAICFPRKMADDETRRAALDRKLIFQRELIKNDHYSGDPDYECHKFATWESQFKAWEIDTFMKTKTWYTVRCIREIKPVPLCDI